MIEFDRGVESIGETVTAYLAYYQAVLDREESQDLLLSTAPPLPRKSVKKNGHRSLVL